MEHLKALQTFSWGYAVQLCHVKHITCHKPLRVSCQSAMIFVAYDKSHAKEELSRAIKLQETSKKCSCFPGYEQAKYGIHTCACILLLNQHYDRSTMAANTCTLTTERISPLIELYEERPCLYNTKGQSTSIVTIKQRLCKRLLTF